MLRALSTHVFLRQHLHSGLLDTLTRGGAHSLHAPLYAYSEMGLGQTIPIQRKVQHDAAWRIPFPLLT